MATQRISIGWISRKKVSGYYGGHNVRVMVYSTPGRALGAQKRYSNKSDEDILKEWDILEAFIEVPLPVADGD